MANYTLRPKPDAADTYVIDVFVDAGDRAAKVGSIELAVAPGDDPRPLAEEAVRAFLAPPKPYVRKVGADDVRAEAQRRIIALTGASDLTGCVLRELNALMRAGELADKRLAGEALSPAEEAEAAGLRALADGIKAIRAASNALEPDSPADFTADHHWPART